MRKILGFLACLLMLITAGNVLAAGYTCPTYKKYTSCKSGYYISNCPTSSSSWTGQTISSSSLTTGNSCKACPTNYTCTGGLVCPKAKTVTCSAGYYLPANATSCSACGGNRYWCPGGTFTPSSSAQGRNSVTSGYYTTGGTSTTRTGQSACGSNAYYCTGGVRNRVSSGYYSTGGTSTTRTGQSQCTGATYCASGVKNNCPSGYTANTTAGKTSASQCQISCAAGTRVATKNGSCTTSSGAWFSSATTTNYGQVSLYNFCPKGFNSSSTSASGHDASTDCKISISGGKYISANNMQARYVKLWSSGNTTNTLTHVIEIQAFASSNGTGTNLLSGKGGTRGSNLTNATNGSWSRSAYASGTTGDLDLIWDMGSVQTVGSIKFAMYTDGRTYNDVQIALSTNGTTWTTVLGPVDIITQNLTTASPHLLVVAPSQQNSCPAGTAISSRTKALLSAAGSCSACTGRTKYSAAGASSCRTVSSGYYTTGCNTSGNNCTGQTQCTGATYCASGVKNNCPSGYTANTTAGKTAASQCQISCAAGARVAERGATCTSEPGNWVSQATTTNYGKVSLVYYCPAGFFAPGNTAADHDEPTDCVISVSGGHYIPSNTMTARYIRMQTTSYPLYVTEIQAFASNMGTGTNFLLGKSGIAGSNLTNATNNNWSPTVYASGTNLIWDIGSVQTIGSIKFALTGYVSTSAPEVVMSVSNDGQEWTLIMDPTPITPQYGVAQLSGELLFVAPSEELQCSAGTFAATRSKPLLNAADTCTQCTGATYSGAGASACTSCPAQTSGWTRATGTGWTSYTSCYQTKSGTAISSYCSSGTLKQTATSSSAWGATTISSALSAKAGAYVNGQTCSQCTSGYYCTGGTTARKACSTLASGFYPNSAAGSDAATDCYTNNLSGQYVASAKATSATPCANWTYKGSHTVKYGSTSSCTSCPAQTSGWTRATGTGWTSYTSCYQTKSGTAISSYCSSGTLKQTATSSSAWGATTISSALSAKAGAYVNGQTCSQCTSGYYCTGGTTARKACSTLASGFYPNSAAGSDAATDCYTNNLSGQYVASAKATSASTCAAGTYKGKHSVKYGSTSSCSACTGATYSGAGASSCTSCPKATKYLDRVTSYSYWTSDGVHDDRYGCRAFIKEDDPNGDYTLSCSLSGMNEDYGVLGGSQHCMASGISSCVGGYYAPSGTSNTWAESVEALKDVVCVDAGKGYYSPEGNIDRTLCPTGYTDGDAATAESGCKMNVDAGQYVASAKATSATPCANWTYKGAHTVNYGSTSSCTSCPTLTSGWTKATGTGWTSYTSCSQTKSGTAISSYCSSGTLKQTATSSTTWGATTISSALSAKAGAYVNGQTCSQCTSGYYCTGGTTARKACVIGSYSAAGATSCIACANGKTTSAAGSSSCNATCSNANDSEGEAAVKGWVDATWNTNNTVSNLCKAASCLGGENGHYLSNGNCPRCDSFANGLYPRSSNSGTTKGQEACFLYTADIPGKYIASQRATSATLCQKGTYSAGSTSRVVHYGETSSCNGCPDNTYADEQGLTACKSCLENYTTYGEKTSPSACRILCQGGSYLASPNATQCSNVGSGYWAPQAYVTQGNVGTRNRCATGLTTIGFGSGADEEDDCGRVLHIGDGKLYLRSTKKTDLALNVNIGGTTYYGNMSTEDKFMSDGIEKSLKLNVNGTIYSVYDDSADDFFGGGETGLTINPNLTATTIVPASYNEASSLSWSATLSDGTKVSGVGACDSTTAENGEISSDGFSPSGTGSGCWCKINSPAQGVRYVYGTTNSSCSTKCGYFCANNMKGTSAKNITYRTNLYTTAGISVQ